MQKLRTTLVVALATWAIACSDDTTATVGAGGATTSTTTTGGGMGAGASGGMGGALTTTSAMGGMGAGGASSSTGGSPPMHPGVLVDDGLVVRYYLDEATDGQGPMMALDAAPQPLDLPITYIPEMAYSQTQPGQTGLRWTEVGLGGRPTTPTNGTKLIGALESSMTATLEVVVDVTAVSGSNSRFLHIGFDADNGRLTMSAGIAQSIKFFVNDEYRAEGFSDLTAGRATIHTVFDSTATDPNNRSRIYVNGGRLPLFGGSPPPQNDIIVDLASKDFAIGNREIGGRSMDGTLHYAAIYSQALTDEQLLQNALLLLENDDTPVP